MERLRYDWLYGNIFVEKMNDSLRTDKDILEKIKTSINSVKDDPFACGGLIYLLEENESVLFEFKENPY